MVLWHGAAPFTVWFPSRFLLICGMQMSSRDTLFGGGYMGDVPLPLAKSRQCYEGPVPRCKLGIRICSASASGRWLIFDHHELFCASEWRVGRWPAERLRTPHFSHVPRKDHHAVLDQAGGTCFRSHLGHVMIIGPILSKHIANARYVEVINSCEYTKVPWQEVDPV